MRKPYVGGRQRRRLRLGLTAYAVKLLGDMKHLEWSLPAGSQVDKGQPIGTVEASKATSDLFAPAAGILLEFNPAVVADPLLLNSNLYDEGWLFRMQAADRDAQLLSPQEYLALIESVWPLAQRILKGQAGRHGHAPIHCRMGRTSDSK